MEWSKLFHGVGSNLMPSYSARTSGATSGASAGAGIGVQSDEEDRIQTESGINQFLTASNQLFSQGQQVTSQANLAYGGPMSEDIQRQFDEQFSNYETQRDTQDLSADRDMSSIGLARTEAVEKVDDLVSSLEIDKLKYS